MTHPLPSNDHRALLALAQKYISPLPHIAVVQIATTILPLLLLLATMHAALAYGWWPALLLGIPAGALVVRVFALQHDCGHGSLFRSRAANTAIGRLCSMFTFTPYGHWRRQHAQHHAVWNDLDRRDRGADIYSTCTTVAEYLGMSPGRRLLHRAVRHPVVTQFVLPPLVFLALYRFPFDTPKNWRRERRGVYLTNLWLLLVYGALAALLGPVPVALVLGAVMLPASIAGVWLFSVQHRFEGVAWVDHAAWNHVDASLKGSSYLRLPRVLRWCTGNLGFHHIHHLVPRLPNYRLEECHNAHPAFTAARVLTLRDAFLAPRYVLWHEAAGRMLTFAEAHRLARPDRGVRTPA